MNQRMTEDLTHILIFKTNIRTLSDKFRVQKIFADHGAVEDWNVDSEDIDCVLRVVSYVLSPEDVIRQINNIGFDCQELQ